MKISQVSSFQVSGSWEGTDFPPGDRQAQALDIYPEFNVYRPYFPKAGDRVSAVYLQIQTDEGASGLFGPIEHYQAYLIDSMLAPFLVGRDPLAIETLHDQMLRLHRHGRSGLFVTGVSAIDCALWDLKGKVFGQPVYRLLGGPTRPSIPAYASMLSYPVDPQGAADWAREIKGRGYQAQKWFFRWGPGDGAAGMEKNLAMATAVREAVGPGYFLAFDAFMGWDETYAIRMGQALAPLQPAWMEEPIAPERVSGLARIRAAAGVPLATGEHVYTRWQVSELIDRQAVDWLQTDPDWTGGISEQIKICALASAHGIPVIAHGHSLLPALHVAAAQPAHVVPMVEYLLLHQETKQFFHKPVYQPENGHVDLPDLPGLGLVLDEQKIHQQKSLAFSEH